MWDALKAVLLDLQMDLSQWRGSQPGELWCSQGVLLSVINTSRQEYPGASVHRRAENDF